MNKIIGKLWMLGAMAFLLSAGAFAQPRDARQRSAETIVADALAQLPAARPELFNEVMGELAATGSEGVEMIAGMLVPASEGENAVLEYALNGIVAYVTAPGQEALREGVRRGLLQAVADGRDNTNRAFLLSQLQLCAAVEDAPALLPYLDDPYLGDPAFRVLIAVPGTEDLLAGLAAKGNLTQERKRALAYAFGEKEMVQTEPILLEWLAGAAPETKAAIYKALARCGLYASVRPLAEAAAKTRYANERTGATECYLYLLSRLVKSENPAPAVKAAKGLLRCDRMSVRGAALAILAEGQGVEKTMPELLAAVRKGPAEYRFAALEALGTGDETIFARVAAGMPRYDAEAQAAVIAWLGEWGIASQDAVITGAVASADARVAKAAIEASGRIGGDEALTALARALEGPHAAEAAKALLAFNGSINDRVAQLLGSEDPKILVPALGLAAARRMTPLCDRVFTLLDASNAEVAAAAYAALPCVVGTQDADRVAALLDTVAPQHIAGVQQALTRALETIPSDGQYTEIYRYMQASETPERYYPVLAHTGTTEAVENLVANFEKGDREQAFAALLTVENPGMPEILYRIAAENPALADRALRRYADLVAQGEYTPDNRYQLCRQGLELNPSAAVRGRLLGNLTSVHTLPTLTLAGSYLDDPEVAERAAGVVRTIVAKTSPMFGGEAVRAMLEKARAIYRSIPEADAGYAADEITGLLAKLPAEGVDVSAAPVFELSAEEQAQGYEVLFDGHSLHKWTGNKVNYVPLNGVIDVTAAYGGDGNLYTVKEYGDFDLRFEFRFVQEGVNNGIGIRTPMGVDAAYHGMEIQVLDHDAPIYKNLHVYQQHGSVYGVIPAKHVVFGERGTWNTMEIHAEGEHITVKVNGGVIVDGNIREACGGHHVAPDGAKENPYTVDHRNHPGLFNKKGHVGLLGHGAGIQFRKLRILDLTPNAKRR